MTDSTTSRAKEAVVELLVFAASVTGGLLLAYATLVYFVMPVLGFPGDLTRIIKLEQRLPEGQDLPHRVIIVSNSAGVEGIDASVVGQQLSSDYNVENQSANGLELFTGRLYIGRILEGKPEAIVWLLRPETMGEILAPKAELALAMRFASFDTHNPWMAEPDALGLTPETRDRFNASEFSTRIALRTIPVRHLNERVRILTRKGILAAKPLETVAPFQMEIELTGPKLQRHIDDVINSLSERTADGNTLGIDFIEQTVKQISDAGVTPILVIAPTHPLANELFAPAESAFAQQLRGIESRTQATVIDLSATLTAELFADAIHPNRAGAADLSARLGQELWLLFSKPKGTP